MVYTGSISAQQRTAAASGTAFAVFAVGALLAGSFAMPARAPDTDSLVVFDIEKPPPPPDLLDKGASGEASEANTVAEAAAVSAPPPKILLPVLPPIAAAPVSGAGDDASAGAAPDPGPGSGAGGHGNGMGRGGAGNGAGGGTRPMWRSGAIRNSDYPDSASRAHIGGDVEVRFTVLTSGRVADCHVVASSGHGVLDERTCRLIEKRFRFRPATDATGAPIASDYGWRQSWWLEPRG